MSENAGSYLSLHQELDRANATLVAVSKTKSAEAILQLYEQGQRDFGENYVQELLEKQSALPRDIQWHFIGHLQSNKVKYIAPFIYLIHSVDSEKLLREINKQAARNNRIISVLLQVHIAREETKFGFDDTELELLLRQDLGAAYPNAKVIGLMGMASFSDDSGMVREEFRKLKQLYQHCLAGYASAAHFRILSMGMSSDYRIALEEGSNLVRIGSLLFGART